VDADVATMTLLERLNDGGEVFLTHTTVGGQVVLRAAIGAPATTRAHVERAWTLLCEGHDWLAADFAESAAERAREEAERRAAAERAQEEAARATALQPVETPATQDETAAQAHAQEDLTPPETAPQAEADRPGADAAPL
jgi:aromatic-L-amino-acid/L-tryptophan decarboxylase